MEAYGYLLADGGIVVLAVISGLLAYARGFAREALSLGALALGAVATYYLLPFGRPIARGLIASELVADGIAVAILFLATWMVALLLSRPLARRVRESNFGPADRWLGLVFGALRGGLIVVVLYILLSWVLPADEQPDWLQDAWSMPAIRATGDWLLAFFPGFLPGDLVLAGIALPARGAAEEVAR